MSVAPETAIHAALMARVETLSTSLPISYPGVTFDAPDGDYIRVTHMRNEADRRTLDGAYGLRRQGILQLDLFTRVTAGSYQVIADGIAEEIAEHFPRDLPLTNSGHKVAIYATTILEGRRDPDIQMWHTPIRVDYRGVA